MGSIDSLPPPLMEKETNTNMENDCIEELNATPLYSIKSKAYTQAANGRISPYKTKDTAWYALTKPQQSSEMPKVDVYIDNFIFVVHGVATEWT